MFIDTLHPVLKKDVVYALEQPGKLFYIQDNRAEKVITPAGVWALLPLLITQQLFHNVNKQYACCVAVAIECFICALDLLDDIEDDDPTPIVSSLGTARVLNTSTTLLMLTHHILLSLPEFGISPTKVVSLLNALQKAALDATVGQHRDILAEQRSAESFTFEECIEIAEGKAGSLMSLACRIGALCADASEAVLSQFSELGKLLGIAHQLDNDSHDLYHILQYQQTNESTGTLKTDLARQKKTLPIVLAAHATSALQNSSFATDEEKQKIRVDVLHEGITTTWGISLLYRERAHDQLQQIEVQYPISHTLRLLLSFA
ncbi:MAG: hypothetical protein NVS4B11_01530 [Ktedonobacteraceae bacterium]